MAYAAAGANQSAKDAFRKMLTLAIRQGDLDGSRIARAGIEGSSLAGKEAEEPSFRRRIAEAVQLARSDPRKAYARLHALRRAALRMRGWRTATECLRALVVATSHASNSRSGARIARKLFAQEATSWSYLALAFAEEHNGRFGDASSAYSRALRLASREGDLHRIEAATEGLRRVEGKRRGQMRRTDRHGVVPPFTDLKRVLGL
jgi:hypothetical protein